MEEWTSAGWTLSVGSAGVDGVDRVQIRRGEDLGAPARGLLALLASGDLWAPEPAETASLAAGLFTEGYFGALATLSPARAAAQALTTANSWLYSHQRAREERKGIAASLIAVAFARGGCVLLHIGAQRALIRQDGGWREIASPQTRALRGGVEALTRGVGLDEEAQATASQLHLRPGDRLALLSPALADVQPMLATQGDAQALAVALAGARGCALVLDVVAIAATDTDPAVEQAALPLRAPPQEGDVVDGFQIGRTIYRGQYTLLRRAWDSVENRDVALKFPLPAMAQDDVFRQGFLREAWIGARLGSRWTVEYWQPPPARRSRLYLVMPYLRGRTLEERLQTAPPVSLAEGVGVGISVCEAISDLAQREVVHGDIKPENLFLLQEGGIKLLDLGLASLAGLDAASQERLGGTTRYMAPELFRGAAPSPRTEVFALAVTLHRLFTGGEFPFGRRLLRTRPDLPRWLAGVLSRALAFDPGQRYRDADALREALLQGLANEDWRGPPAPRFTLDFWKVAAMALGGVCLALAFALWRR